MRPTQIDPSQYQSLLNEKQRVIEHQFSSFSVPQIAVFNSPPLHYRMRAEFRVWHDGDDLYHIMFDQTTREKYRVDDFPPACQLINDMMTALLPKLKNNDVLRRKLFQIDYLASQSGQIVVSLLYHKQLDDIWTAQIEQLLIELREEFDVHIIGRARKQKFVFDADFVIETLNIKGKRYQFKQTENSFTQPNASVNEKMISWAMDISEHYTGDLLELYCGLGNFTLPLASRFPKVCATEISKSSVAAAKFNMQINDIENVAVARMSSEEFSACLQSGKLNKRLQEIEFEQFNCETILVDPPRAGLDDDTLALVSTFKHIIYISCNPDSLAENLAHLTQTHEIDNFALFDQFPYTHHAECGVSLTRK
jgi:tRNA (uracil-5-)-methyltransferase